MLIGFFPVMVNLYQGRLLILVRIIKGAKDNYIYIYGNDRSDWRNLYLVRVAKDKIHQRTAYEFLSGLDDSGNPKWSNDVNARKK